MPGMRILMTPELGRAWRGPLYESGCDVVECAFNRDALLEAAAREEPDVVLLNALLFGLDAASAAKALRAMALTRTPALLTLFPGAPMEAMRRAREEGAIPLEAVSLTVEALLARVGSLTLSDRLVPFFAGPERVEKALRTLSLSEGTAGFRYLTKAVSLCARDQRCFRALSGSVYPEIGRQYGASAASVERLMRHAIESAWLRGDMERQYALFGNTVDEKRGKPTNGEFIARVTEALRLEATI